MTATQQQLWAALDQSRRVRGCIEAYQENAYPGHLKAAARQIAQLEWMLSELADGDPVHVAQADQLEHENSPAA